MILALAAAFAGETPVDTEITVVAPPRPPTEQALDTETASLADATSEAPGVATSVRGGNAGEIVVRGMSWERVPVRVGGVPVLGACPSRMDPPAAVVPGDALDTATLSLGLPSVTAGPLGTGGSVEASPFISESTGARAPALWASGRFGSARDALAFDGGATFSTDAVAVRFAGGTGSQGDYRAPDGRVVPSSRTWHHGSLAVDVTPTDRLRWSTAALLTDDRNTDFPALPMDERSSQLLLGTTRLQILPASDLVDVLTVRGGVSTVAHTMDNADKPNRGMMAAETDSTALTVNGALEAALSPTDRFGLTLGTDINHVHRDALRVRTMTAGPVFEDALWPGVRQTDLGAFGEARLAASDRLRITAGARADLVNSRAEGDAAGLGGLTAADHYARFYGEEAADVDATQLAGGGNVLATFQASDVLVTYAGVGYAARAAQATERYFTFAPAPGGFAVGNPTLPTEKLLEVELGAHVDQEIVEAGVAVWAHEVGDYVLPTLLAQQDVNGDGTADAIRGYVPVDARLLGFEASTTLHLGDHLHVPAQASFVHGQDLDAGAPLPEIAPFEARVAVRTTWGDATPWFVQAGTRVVAAQPRVAPKFMEDATEGFATVEAAAGLELAGHLSVRVEGTNLTNALYNEHLTREVALPVGDLEKGDEVPAPGRALNLSMRARF